MLRTPHPAANRVRYQPLFAVQQTRFLLAESVVCLRCLSGHWLQERPSAHIELRIGRHRFLRFSMRMAGGRSLPRLRPLLAVVPNSMGRTVRRVKKSGEDLRQFNHHLSTPGVGADTSIAEL